MTEKMTSPPDTIYLQWHGEPYYNGTIDPDAGGNEVTWCEDEVWDVDIKYLLATPERKKAVSLYSTVRRLIDMRATMAPEIQATVVKEARRLLDQIDEEEK